MLCMCRGTVPCVHHCHACVHSYQSCVHSYRACVHQCHVTAVRVHHCRVSLPGMQTNQTNIPNKEWCKHIYRLKRELCGQRIKKKVVHMNTFCQVVLLYSVILSNLHDGHHVGQLLSAFTMCSDYVIIAKQYTQ